MGLQDRDYIHERAKLQEKESKKSKTRILNKTTLIGTILLILLSKGIGLIKNLKTPIINPVSSEPIKRNDIIKPEKNRSIKTDQQQENTKHKSWICSNPKTEKEKCKFLN
jgi:hypothetical protein